MPMPMPMPTPPVPSSVRPSAVLVALAALPMFLGCSRGDVAEPAVAPECAPALAGQWTDPAVLDPRPPPLNRHQPGPTFNLHLRITERSAEDWSVSVNADILSSAGYPGAFEGGPSTGPCTCPTDPLRLEGTVLYLLTDSASPREETIEAALTGDRLVGTLIVEGHQTAFEATRL